MDIYFSQGSRSQRSCGLMGGVGAILRPDERKMILKEGKDIRFQATPGQARIFFLISADTSWLGERGGRQAEWREDLPSGGGKRGKPEGRGHSGFKEINLESFSYKNNHWQILAYLYHQTKITIRIPGWITRPVNNPHKYRALAAWFIGRYLKHHWSNWVRENLSAGTRRYTCKWISLYRNR